MYVSWTVTYDWDFNESELMGKAADVLKRQKKPINAYELAKKAVDSYIPCLDDVYYYSISQEAVNYVKSQFFEEHRQELEKMILKAGLLKTSQK